MSETTDAITGRIEKALLVVHDYSNLAKNLGQDGKPAEQAGGSNTGTDTASILKGNPPPTYPSSEERYFRVRFNPSELAMNSSTNVARHIDVQTKKMVVDKEKRPSITLSVPLYFDDVKVWDAFLWDRFHRPENVALAAKESKDNVCHSVQGEVEALIAALQDPNTRSISFRWANFYFIGQLSSIQAKYTMFSPSGQPIRAQVLLRINHEVDNDMMKEWFDSYNKVFPTDGEVSLALGGQNVGTILNL